jgi:RND family efflux transporter MFP subunit
MALWIVLGLIVAGIVALRVIGPRPGPVEEKGEKPALVRTRRVRPRDLPDVLVLPGRINAGADVVLSAEKNGRVLAVTVDEGDRVERGQVLLRLDDRLWREGRARAGVERRESGKELARREKLRKTGAVSQSELEAAQTRAELAAVALAEFDVHISQCEVRAPVAGTVEARRVDAGEYVREGDVVFRLVDLSRVDIACDVPERDIAGVETGALVKVTVPVAGDLSLTGRVHFAASAASPGSNAFRVELRAANPGGRLKDGMIARVHLARRAAAEALAVPLGAIVPRRGDHVVYVVSADRAEARVVRLDRLVGNEAVIGAGLEGGEEIVVEGQRTLQDGALIERAAAGPGPAAP